jgi:hypothetical protein
MIDDLKIWLERKRFVPFRILLINGTGYEVTSPHQVAIGQTQFNYYFPKSDRKATVRLNQLVAFVTLEGSAA